MKRLRLNGKEILIRLSITLVSTIITVIVFEITIRVSNFYPIFSLQLETLDAAHGFRVTLDPDILFRSQPHSGLGIDQRGFRQHPVDLAAQHSCRILFMGDSFLMSNNLPVNETVPEQLRTIVGSSGTDTELQVFNAAISGYGPDQAYLLSEELVPDVKPDMLVLGVFAGNDYEDLVNNRVFELSESGKLQRSRSNPVTEVLPLFRLEMLFRMLFSHQHLPADDHQRIAELFFHDKEISLDTLKPDEQQTRIALMRGVLELFQASAIKHQLPFLVILFPALEGLEARPNYLQEGADPFGNEHTTRELLDSLNIPVLDLTEPFQQAPASTFFDMKYEHLNSFGTLRTAELLRTRLLDLENVPTPCHSILSRTASPPTPEVPQAEKTSVEQ